MDNLNKLNKSLICTYNSGTAQKSRQYEQNRDYLLEYSKQYYRNNVEKKKEYAKTRAKENPEAAQVKKLLRKRKIKRATPSWVSIEELNLIYKNKPQGFHVDHIIPISNKLVCGLNVPWNLQYLSAKDNIAKSNSFDGTKNNDAWKTKKEPQP